MHWKLFATIAETAGEREFTVDLDDGATVGDALDALFERHPELREPVLDDSDDEMLREHLTLLCGETDPFIDGAGFSEPVAADETLALFPPVSGG
ncbi:molybdopterin synthase sulfur carrier subunit [Halobacteriales archaeon QH_7_65_31]|nr:MAG: molybdopterin synthase sulfur carrier subunit [Halobacteriales archaeon QH_7_65_31]